MVRGFQSKPGPSDVLPTARLHHLNFPQTAPLETKCSSAQGWGWGLFLLETTMSVMGPLGDRPGGNSLGHWDSCLSLHFCFLAMR